MSMSYPDFKSESFARMVVERLLPEARIRRACMTLLADSILLADDLGHSPGVWSATVSRQKNFVGLNVGRLQVLAFYFGTVRLVLDNPEAKVPAYESVPTSYSRENEAKDLKRTYRTIAAAHRDLSEKAINTVESRTPFYAHCSLGLLQYLRTYLKREIPNPIYD